MKYVDGVTVSKLGGVERCITLSIKHDDDWRGHEAPRHSITVSRPLTPEEALTIAANLIELAK